MWVARMTGELYQYPEPWDEGGYLQWRRHTDIGNGRRNANFDAGVTLLGQLALEEFVQFGVEDSIGDELPSLGDRRSLGCGCHDCDCY